VSAGLAWLVAVPLALLLAWWPWRDALDRPAAWTACGARALGILALLLLLLDPGYAARAALVRPLVLLDRSLSMQAGGRSPEAIVARAVALGDTLSFGVLAGGEPAGPTLLEATVRGALGGGRPLVILTDGEIADAGALPLEVRDRLTVELVPRPVAPDVAVTQVRASERLTVGDTLEVEVEVRRFGGGDGDVTLALRDGATELATTTVRPGPEGMARGRLVLAWPATRTGHRWLEVVRVGAADAEPSNDLRWHSLMVAPTPGVVMVATTPDVDARTLYRTLRDVVDGPVRGYVALAPGRWSRMDDLRAVGAAEVMAAARAADLLVVRGDTGSWRGMGGARLVWPAGGSTGDWYVVPMGPAPVGTALDGAEPAALPPLAAVVSVPTAPDGWVAVGAQLARRGAVVPIAAGTVTGTRRQVVFGGQGMHRWAMRGGAPEQAWRTLVAGAVGWLLASPPQTGARAVPTHRVTPRGRPVAFRWTGTGAPEAVSVRFESDGTTREDTLRFGEDALAHVVLPVGRYRAMVAGVDAGPLGVEPFSAEFVPGPVTLGAGAATMTPPPTRRSLRDLLPLFALAIAGVGVEWLLRRRLGRR
jgi:hypothetical protein